MKPSENMVSGTASTRTVYVGLDLLSPVTSQRIVNHSPDGFNWGFGGSGPAQLALALLLHLSTRDFALLHYQQFKCQVIASLPQTDFVFSIQHIRDWIAVRSLDPTFDTRPARKD